LRPPATPGPADAAFHFRTAGGDEPRPYIAEAEGGDKPRPYLGSRCAFIRRSSSSSDTSSTWVEIHQ
jgi:hypothetical protein